MTSVVSICNLALTRAGIQRISSLTEASEPSRQCALLYEPTRDSMLQAHPWRFARSRQILAELELDELDRPKEFTHVYRLPSNCLKPLYIEPEGFTLAHPRVQSDGTPVWDRVNFPQATPKYETRAGRTLLTDVDGAALIYTARIEDPTQFDELFVEALSWRLGADLAMGVKSDAKKRRELQQEMISAIDQARAADGASATIRTDDHEASWVKAR